MYQKRLKMVFNSKNTLFAEHYANVNGNSWTSMNEGRTRKSNDRSCENQSPILASKPVFFQSNNCSDLNSRFVCAFRWKMTLSEIQEMKADVKRIIEVINSAEKLSNHSETWQSVWNLVYMRIFFASAYVTKKRFSFTKKRFSSKFEFKVIFIYISVFLCNLPSLIFLIDSLVSISIVCQRLENSSQLDQREQISQWMIN